MSKILILLNKVRYALCLPTFCRGSSHDTERNQRKIKAIGKGLR